MANDKQLTNEEILAKIKAEKQEALENKIKADTEAGFLNPFDEGVNYKHFLAAIPKGKTVNEYLIGKVEKDLIKSIEADLEHYAPYAEFKKQLKTK